MVLVGVVLAFGRMAWRIFMGNEEMQSGGSDGNQMFGRTRRKKRDQKRSRRRRKPPAP